MSLISRIFGDANAKYLKKIRPAVERINAFEPEFEKLRDEELLAKSQNLGVKCRQSESKPDLLDETLPEAFALVREAAKRTLNQRHFDVQLLGGIVIHQGKITEMKTGEGKTLVATLPAYLNSLSGRGVHIVTVNDYLARRDTVWMGQIYNVLGLTVGCINHEASYIYDPAHSQIQNSKTKIDEKDKLDHVRDIQGSFRVMHEYLRPCSRKEAYAADITYGTNNEFGFDYLRDNLVYSSEQISQRGHHFAIIDEVDSILIDEARTPLIISAPDETAGELYRTFAKIAKNLQKDKDYKVDEKHKSATITEEGIDKVENLFGIKDIYAEGGIKYVHHLEQALKAEALFQRDKDYVVKNGEVLIVDEFTGRLMPGRRWSEGLHQAVEAKEGVQIQKESRTVASITFQNYFRLYEKLSGMTGTAATSAEEFHKVYNLDVIVIPTNKPMVRRDFGDKIFSSEKGKWKAAVREVKERHGNGQPVLLGTASIEKNELISALLGREGIKHEVLNAKNHEREGEIIAQAGKLGAVTVATNMAGRGVDVVLGGNPPNPEEAQKVSEAGGLFVLGTERHEARRIDNQLRGRSGRQGDPGQTQFFVSFDDDLMRIFGSEKIKKMMSAFGIPEDEAVENKMVSRALESAQSKVEGFNFDARKHLLEYDDVMNRHRGAIYRRRQEILFSSFNELFLKTNELFIDETVKEKFIQKFSGPAKVNLAPSLKYLWLQTIDHFWLEHLEEMEYMRSSVRLRAYGQRDPLVEYKNEAARLFHGLENVIESHVADMALRIGSEFPRQDEIKSEIKIENVQNKPVKSSAFDKVGRNDPCPCGAKKSDGASVKYKHCHSRNA
jgi:preprotein translocase subunit SecA